jgi:diadenosine tetraphosphatase ApaH/serine/threonine PP2A family protein phosphatase
MPVGLNETESELASLRRQLAEARENLRLIQERKSEYVLGTDIPLQLVKQEQELLKRIEELEQRVQGSEGTSKQATRSAIPLELPRKLRVFLCHASGDKPTVRGLYHRLRADGFDPWFDEESLLPGQDWQLEIPKAVRSSDAVIICLSSRAITKAGYVQKEIRYALDVADEQPEGAIFLIPLRLEECEVPERLRRRVP